MAVILGAETAQGMAATKHLLKDGNWVVKASSSGQTSALKDPSGSLLPFPELHPDLFSLDDRKWREKEDTITSAMRGAFGVYIASFPTPRKAEKGAASDWEADSEMEVRMAQRLGRAASHAGVHLFVFSGRDVRSEACVMSLTAIPSLVFLRVDTLFDDLQAEISGSKIESGTEDDTVALISAHDLGIAAAKAFTDPQKLRLPGRVSINPVSVEIASRRKVLERLRSSNGFKSDSGAIFDVAAPQSSDKRRQELRKNMAATLQLLPSALNLSNWIAAGPR